MLKKLVMLLSLCCSSISLFSISSETLNVNAENKKESVVVPETYYTTLNGYNYQIDGNLKKVPDSIEAWVKLPVASIGGTVVGSSYIDEVHWGVDASGKVKFSYNYGAIKHTFSSSKNISDNEWHHIAVVRTDKEFTYYLDGKYEDSYEIESEDVNVIDFYNIGAGVNGRINPFEGYIKQVTLYTGAISAEQVLSDMNNTYITEDDVISKESKIIGNWNFGEYWTERFVKNTVIDGQNASLHTHEKYLNADYSFGEYDYTFVIFPDIQIMTNYNPTRLNNQIQWLADNKEKYNVKFAMFVGDLSDFGQREPLYQTAANAMDRLNNKIPYCFVPGNHDYDDNAGTRNQTYFKTHFPVSKHSQLPGFGGVFEEDNMANSYYLFDADGIEYLVLNLEYNPRMSVLRWAGRIIEAHPNHRVIVETHNYLQPNGEFEGKPSAGYEANASQKIFDALISKYDNVFFAVGGHRIYDDVVYRVDNGINGNKIISMLTDAQGVNYKGEGAQDILMLVHVNEAKKTMNFVYYSPEKGKLWNIQNQFQLSIADSLNPAIGE